MLKRKIQIKIGFPAAGINSFTPTALARKPLALGGFTMLLLLDLTKSEMHHSYATFSFRILFSFLLPRYQIINCKDEKGLAKSQG